MKLLGQFSSQSGTAVMKEGLPTYREKFVPPEMSMVSYFLNKVRQNQYTNKISFPWKLIPSWIQNDIYKKPNYCRLL